MRGLPRLSLVAVAVLACAQPDSPVAPEPNPSLPPGYNEGPAPVITITDLGTLGGFEESRATAISDHGVVVGFSRSVVTGRSQWFRWTAETGIVDLGERGRAHDINIGGDIVGERNGRATMLYAAEGSSESMVDLGSLGGARRAALGINKLTQVVGEAALSSTDPSRVHAFVWTRRGGMRDLGALPGHCCSRAHALNAMAKVVGVSGRFANPGMVSKPFMWTPVGGMVELTGRGVRDGEALDINDSDVVVGFAFFPVSATTFQRRAFRWTAATGMVDLTPGEPSEARGINALGEIAGSRIVRKPGAQPERHAVLWTTDGRMLELGALVERGASEALAVNDVTQIVGFSTAADGHPHATLWTVEMPRPETPMAVAIEPANINLRNDGRVRVTAHGSPTVPLAEVEPTTIRLGVGAKRGVPAATVTPRDVNRDAHGPRDDLREAGDAEEPRLHPARAAPRAPRRPQGRKGDQGDGRGAYRAVMPNGSPPYPRAGGLESGPPASFVGVAGVRGVQTLHRLAARSLLGLPSGSKLYDPCPVTPIADMQNTIVAASRKRTTRSIQSSPLRHIAIECVTPELDGGRFPVKRVIGDAFAVSADILKDGHDRLAARARYRAPGEGEWRYAPLTYDFNSDRWYGGFPLDAIGAWTYTIEAWTDQFGTWRSELEKKVGAGQDVSLELLEGAELVESAARRTRFGEVRTALKSAVMVMRDAHTPLDERLSVALAPQLLGLMEASFVPTDVTAYDRELVVWVDRERARFAAWYEMFPRSQTDDPAVHGTFASAERGLPRIAELGFDVLYLPPIHPIGRTNRKGRNNSLHAGPDDPGSPWAIGSEYGGHDAVDPRLGTIEDFDHFVAAAHRLGMEVALDYALQCSPDHPWLKEHPDWFFIRPDGSLKYAENPPKKYQDIYPLNLWCEDREALWAACRDVLLFWIGHGVRTFRVDNPHTKPFAFWEWVIAEVRRAHPEAVFLSEAFTRPKRMKHLAKLGFTQSYTYFTWRNQARELREYLTELTQGPAREYLRANFFANTPDILHEYLQTGGRRAFRVRLLLAATLSPLYGIYSGFELCENVPLRAGSEEYLDSEKYEIRVRNWSARGNINTDVARINRIRRENRALQLYSNLTFHHSENEQILFYAKSAPERANDLLIAVNLDPYRAQETMVHVPVDALGLRHEEPYWVEDLLTGARYVWRGSRNYVRLDPSEQPGHVLRLVRA